MSSKFFLVFCLSSPFFGICCAPEDPGPDAAQVAAAFGLADGRELNYEVTSGSATSEEHQWQRSGSYADRQVFTRTEFNQGFQRMDDDGTAAVYDFEATWSADQRQGELRLLGRGDCLPHCGDYDPPVVIAHYPLKSSDRVETESVLHMEDNGSSSDITERHVYIVGGEGKLDTPAGSFDVFEIAWQRFVDGGDMQSATIYLSPDRGIVGMERFDGASLRLKEQKN